MKKGKDKMRGDGFAPVGPFKGRPTFIRSGLRPVDPRLTIRIDDLIGSLKSQGLQDDIEISIGIRSLDGFYTNRSGTTLLKIKGEELIDMINFDPTREVFIVSGEGDADISAELIWFAMEAFPEDTVVCITRDDGPWPMKIPEKSDDRINWALDLLRSWKADRKSRIGGYRLFRGGTIEDLNDHLISEYRKDDQKSQ